MLSRGNFNAAILALNCWRYIYIITYVLLQH